MREQDPFSTTFELALPRRDVSPYAGRIRLMWQQMRTPIIDSFPDAPGLAANPDAYLKHVQDVYVTVTVQTTPFYKVC